VSIGSRETILPAHLRIPERAVRVVSGRGVNVAVTDWALTDDDPRPVLFMCHATGLHGHCWIPLVNALSHRFRCIAIDQRGQGDTPVPVVGGLGWEGIADDVEVVLGALGLIGRTDVYGIGHSQGGFAVMETERRRPGTFAGVFLYEPVIFPQPAPEALEAARAGNHMAALAIKRRPGFASWEAAATNFVGKGPFAKADADLISCYVYWGFVEQPDGSVLLKCAPQTEADIFRGSFTDLFDACKGLTCPTTIAIGEFTEPGFATSGPLIAADLPNGRHIVLPGRTHFGIFEGVEEMAALVVSSLLGD
jgi:pimeloyl-ACP methyl ester carboxylesterase